MSADTRPARQLIYPLPRIDGVSPQPSRGEHGVELAYPGHARLPELVPVFAVAAGRLKEIDRSGEIELAHGRQLVSRYRGLGLLLLSPARRQRIAAGDVLGYLARSSPRLAFMLHGDAENADIVDSLHRWVVLPWCRLSAGSNVRAGRWSMDRTIQRNDAKDRGVRA